MSIPDAKFLSILFFTYGFQIERLSMGMTLAVETFLPLVVWGARYNGYSENAIPKEKGG